MAEWQEKGRFVYRAWKYRLRNDPGEIHFLRSRLSVGQTAIDIGTHKGGYSYWMRQQVGETGRVISFEPQPRLFSYLERQKTLWNWPNWTLVNSGVSSRTGQAEIHVPGDGPSPSATLTPDLKTAIGANLTIAITTLDEYLAAENIGPVHFIKCDVEGHEHEVFRGAEKTLRDHHPALLFECEQAYHAEQPISQIFESLRAFGYSGFFFEGSTLKTLREFQSHRHQAPGHVPYVNNFAFYKL